MENSKHQNMIAANVKFFRFPKEWAETIQNKGYQLFDKSLSNVVLVNEE
jgi:hypothetical protein